MTAKLIRALALWAGLLILVLLSLSSVSTLVRVASMAVVAMLIGAVWYWSVQRARRVGNASSLADVQGLPSVTYRQPVILVCGTTLDLMFGIPPSGENALRVTHHGCYVRVPDLTRLAVTVSSLLARRPEWRRQLSVMFVVSPQAHGDRSALAGQLRALCHQLTLARRRTLALPLVMVSHLQSPDSDGAWFSFSGAQSSPDVRAGGGCVSLDDWQRQSSSGVERQRRLCTAVKLRSLVAWMNAFVAPHLASRDRHRVQWPAIWAVTLTPPTSHPMNDHLWDQWLVDKTGFGSARSASVESTLPFPDAVVAGLPRHSGDTAPRRASLIGLWMFAGAGVVALINSAWQNTLLLREISDDLRRYASVSSLTDRSAPQLALLDDAVAALRQDARRLDDHYRQGEPLSLALGLYRGERLRAPLWEAITGYRPPPGEPAAVHSPVRLDSLSLFHPGSADFKPGAAQVLIDALVHIKIRSGWLIVITGHTDATGSDTQNLTLSRARAEAVRDWMQRMGGIPDSCFAVQGLGASQPVAGNETRQGRAANRRVDIRLLPERGACELPATAPGQPSVAHSAITER
jgi:outer membrane protein OmpA-like peptidoglycan-associated protein